MLQYVYDGRCIDIIGCTGEGPFYIAENMLRKWAMYLKSTVRSRGKPSLCELCTVEFHFVLYVTSTPSRTSTD